jgi:hypothetical protein
MSAFDPMAFLEAEFDEPNEKRPPLPVDNPTHPNGYYLATIGTPDSKSGDKDGKPWMQIVLPLTLDIPQQLQDSLKFPPTLKLTDRVFIDLTEQGTIDNAPGRNRGQRMYREATDMNAKGVPFSWRKLEGRTVAIKMKHDLYQGNIQERVDGVFKA